MKARDFRMPPRSSGAVRDLLRHRGGFVPPPLDFRIEALRDPKAVRRFVDGLYNRIAVDPLLKHVFPHPDNAHSRPPLLLNVGRQGKAGGRGADLVRLNSSETVRLTYGA
jgi:hypothetical protein